MDSYIDKRDYELLGGDKYTFSVLSRIIGGECSLLLSDHRRLIVCFTCQPFPVWIWTADGATESELEAAYRLVRENSLMDGAHRFNLKYELAEYFLRRAEDDGLALTVSTNMFAYDCPTPFAPNSAVDGELHRCVPEDTDILVDFYEMFHNAVGIDKQSREQYRINAENGIKNGSIYLWKDPRGKYVASCNWHPVNDMASIGLVYTLEEERRKHYAEHLVYQVTKIAASAGYVPMLYTDADYAASNACYEKIGYVMRGRLCTIS